MKNIIVNMTEILHKKNMDPLYKSDVEICTVLVCAGWNSNEIINNLEAVKTMCAFRFETARRKRRELCLNL